MNLALPNKVGFPSQIREPHQLKLCVNFSTLVVVELSSRGTKTKKIIRSNKKRGDLKLKDPLMYLLNVLSKTTHNAIRNSLKSLLFG
jgi:hypothetical protein